MCIQTIIIIIIIMFQCQVEIIKIITTNKHFQWNKQFTSMQCNGLIIIIIMMIINDHFGRFCCFCYKYIYIFFFIIYFSYYIEWIKLNLYYYYITIIIRSITTSICILVSNVWCWWLHDDINYMFTLLFYSYICIKFH